MKGKNTSLCLAILVGLVFTRCDIYADAQFGNPWYFGGAYSAPATETTTPWFTFTADENFEISGARFVANGINPGTELTVSIKAVDGIGRPTGAALGSNTFLPVASGDWNAVSLPNVTLAAGTVYAVELTTATPGGNYSWRANAGPTGGSQPYGTVDPHFRSGWQSNAPEQDSYIWVLETTSGRAIGQPYRYVSSFSVAQTSLTIGQRFVFSLSEAGGDSFVRSITVPLTIAATAPSAPVTIKLIDGAGTVLSESLLDLSGQAEGSINAIFNLASEVQLQDGSAYYIGLYSNGSEFRSVEWSYYYTDNDPLYNGATYQGTNGYAVLWGTQSNYSLEPDTYLNRDHSFWLTMSSVPEPSVTLLAALGIAIGLVVWRKKARVQENSMECCK